MIGDADHLDAEFKAGLDDGLIIGSLVAERGAFAVSGEIRERVHLQSTLVEPRTVWQS